MDRCRSARADRYLKWLDGAKARLELGLRFEELANPEWFTLDPSLASCDLRGALYAHLNQSFSVTSYNTGESFSVFTSAVIGGLGSLGGAFVASMMPRATSSPLTIAA